MGHLIAAGPEPRIGPEPTEIRPEEPESEAPRSARTLPLRLGRQAPARGRIRAGSLNSDLAEREVPPAQLPPTALEKIGLRQTFSPRQGICIGTGLMPIDALDRAVIAIWMTEFLGCPADEVTPLQLRHLGDMHQSIARKRHLILGFIRAAEQVTPIRNVPAGTPK